VVEPGARVVARLPAVSGATRWSTVAGRAPVRVRLPAGQGEGSRGSPTGSGNGGVETWAARRSSAVFGDGWW
jgi:hypothetical protein